MTTIKVSNIGELIQALKQFSPETTLGINYPNDDQNWPPALILNHSDTEIEFEAVIPARSLTESIRDSAREHLDRLATELGFGQAIDTDSIAPRNCTRAAGHSGPCNGFPRRVEGDRSCYTPAALRPDHVD